MPNTKVRCIESFLNQLPRLNEKMKGNYFYRGQISIEHDLLPSVLRDNMKENEHVIYNYIMTECSEDFAGMFSHAEILSKMQHYGVPTRLLDITNNPLVALYFACEDTKLEKDGAVFWMKPDERDGIKTFDSDIITILSCLPRFNNEEKWEISGLVSKIRGNNFTRKCTDAEIEEFNNNKIIKRLLHEIKKEKPSFENIIVPDDLIKKFFFMPKKNNARIIKQGGAFIIFGLDSTHANGISQDNFNFEHNKIIIDKKCKRNIIDQLSCFGISKATLYPELYKVSEYIKEKYR